MNKTFDVGLCERTKILTNKEKIIRLQRSAYYTNNGKEQA
jgi:hypothetical protein